MSGRFCITVAGVMASMAFPDHLNLYKVGDESGPSIIAAVLVYGKHLGDSKKGRGYAGGEIKVFSSNCIHNTVELQCSHCFSP